MTITDTSYNAKYELGINRLVLEHDSVKLPRLVEKIKLNPNYMMINSEWSSTWDEVTKSRLIESLIINIPVIPVILYETSYRNYEVIDGRERLKTIVDFYRDRLTLTGLEVETVFEGYTYSACPIDVRRRLNNCSLNLINCTPMNENQSSSEIKKLIDAVKERYS